jgi:hypothetical protein
MTRMERELGHILRAELDMVLKIILRKSFETTKCYFTFLAEVVSTPDVPFVNISGFVF